MPTSQKESSKKKQGSHIQTKPEKKKIRKKPLGTCFILMPFKQPFDTYYNAIIKPAVVSAKLEPLRGDSLFRPSPIMADVWAMIQEAKVLVAELTEKNANVFYELGLSHAIGKPVILLSETIDDVPFDLQPLRVILYDKKDPAWGNRLRTTLLASLEETLSDAIGAVPPMFRKAVKSQAPSESITSLRLAALERQVAALRGRQFADEESEEDIVEILPSGELVRPGIPMDILRRDLRRMSSVKESAQYIRKWMRRGLSRDSAKRLLYEFMPSRRAQAILHFARK